MQNNFDVLHKLRSIIRKHNPNAVPAVIFHHEKLTFVQKLLMRFFYIEEDQKNLID